MSPPDHSVLPLLRAGQCTGDTALRLWGADASSSVCKAQTLHPEHLTRNSHHHRQARSTHPWKAHTPGRCQTPCQAPNPVQPSLHHPHRLHTGRLLPASAVERTAEASPEQLSSPGSQTGAWGSWAGSRPPCVKGPHQRKHVLSPQASWSPSPGHSPAYRILA